MGSIATRPGRCHRRGRHPQGPARRGRAGRARTPARRTVRLSGPAGYADLLAWAAGLGRVAAFGVEGTGSYGLGLARFLRRHGVMVAGGARPPRKGQRRLQGKSEPVDAEHAARQVLAGTSVVTPKTGEGAVEAIRLLKVARDTAVKSPTARP